MGALACGRKLDADDCEDKEKEKKNLLVTDPGCGWLWMQMVDGSGGAVDDSARVSLYLEILCEFAQPHITNLLPNISISVKY